MACFLTFLNVYVLGNSFDGCLFSSGSFCKPFKDTLLGACVLVIYWHFTMSNSFLDVFTTLALALNLIYELLVFNFDLVKSISRHKKSEDAAFSCNELNCMQDCNLPLPL